MDDDYDDYGNMTWFDDENDTLECNIELVEFSTDLNGDVTETKTDLGETVTYDINSTPVVDDISPRWGAVSGDK